MRTGNLSSLTERDWASVKERRAFEQAEREKQLLSEDEGAYRDFVGIVNEQNQHLAPAHRIAPIPFEEWRTYADPAISDPVLRGAQATNAALMSKVSRDEAVEAEAESKQAREAVLAGRPDPGWKMPESAKGLRMSVEQAKEFAKTAAAQFVTENPEYYATMNNFETIVAYLTTNGINIPTSEVFKLAWLRLRELGKIEERPAPVSEPTPEPVQEQPGEAVPIETELVDGWDPQTGEPRKYRPYEIHRMSAEQYRLAFRVSPRFTRGYFGRRDIS